MRASTSSLLRLKPIPASQLDLHNIRLPASQAPPRRTAPAPASSPTTSADDTLSSPAPSASTSSSQGPQTNTQGLKQAQLTIAEQLLRKEQQCRLAAASGGDPDNWPSNLRVVKHIHQRDLYWKVPKEQRDQLKKLLREE